MTPEQYEALDVRVQAALAGGITLEEVVALTAELTELYTARRIVLTARHKVALEAAKSERLLQMLVEE